jgi:hypothetical protein
MILNPDLGKQPIKYELKPYESPQPTVIPRGEFYGPSPSLLDIAFLKSLLDITDRRKGGRETEIRCTHDWKRIWDIKIVHARW